jgi:hypothetical protein
MSRVKSAEGGGATTDGEGNVTFEARALACSGAETGGGTTAVLIICTGALVVWRLIEVGAGGITLAANPGMVRT